MMEFLKDWQFWFALINLGGLVLIGCFNWFSHHKIVGNDLLHLSADLKGIADNQVKLDEKVDRLAEDVSYLKGRTEAKSRSYAKKKLKV